MQQIKDAFDVTGFVAEGNSGPTDKNGKRSVFKLEFSIAIEKEHNPNPGSERKKKKHKRAVQGEKGAGGLDLRSGGGPSEKTRPSMAKKKEGKKKKKKRVDQQLPPGDDDDVPVVDSDGKVNPEYFIDPRYLPLDPKYL